MSIITAVIFKNIAQATLGDGHKAFKAMRRLLSVFVAFIFFFQSLTADLCYGGCKNLAPAHDPKDFEFFTAVARIISTIEGDILFDWCVQVLYNKYNSEH